MTVWQIASGDGGRDYSSLFIEHDLMLLGPGDPGEYDPRTYARFVESGQLSAQKSAALASFRYRVQPGDIVLLRKGLRVVAFGVVADQEYEWRDAFDDVQGWDLQHTRRVIWQDDLHRELTDRQLAGALFRDRKQIPMFTKVKDARVLSPIRDLLEGARPRELRALPSEPSPVLDDAALARELFSWGLSNRATDDVIAALNRHCCPTKIHRI